MSGRLSNKMEREDGLFIIVLISVLLLLALRELALPADSVYLEISPKQLDCLNNRLPLELKVNPKYSWGAASTKVGAIGDCSGKAWAMFFT
jgi:hypothetical protein